MTTPITMKSLLEAGVHFGHQTRRWNPRMKRFIFGERNGIHIIDLEQTIQRLQETANLVRDLVADGKTLMFVGTKRQAQGVIESEAKRCGMPYVTNRWLGGTLTNFNSIQVRIDHLVRLEDAKARGEFDWLGKKEAKRLDDEIVRLNRNLGGIKEMTSLPGAVFIIDPAKEHIAVAEALRVGIDVIAMADTNCNPDLIDCPIPSNDDAIRAIWIITNRISDAVVEGLSVREYTAKAALEADEEEVSAYQETGYVASPDEPEPSHITDRVGDWGEGQASHSVVSEPSVTSQAPPSGKESEESGTVLETEPPAEAGQADNQTTQAAQ